MHSEGRESLDPETLLLQGANTQLLEQAMNQLPVRFREVLVLRELEGLSYREIATVVGVPMGTVMSALSRARERFRHAVTDLVRLQERKNSTALSDVVLQGGRAAVLQPCRSWHLRFVAGSARRDPQTSHSSALLAPHI